MMMPKPSLFAEEEGGDRRSKLGSMLVGLSKHNFAALADEIHTALPRPSPRKSGRQPYPTILVIKILISQRLYNLADDALEYQLLDCRSLLQFLGLTECNTIPYVQTIWLFRDRLAQAGLGTKLFDQIRQQLLAHGCVQIKRKGSAIKPISQTQKLLSGMVQKNSLQQRSSK